MKIWNYISEFFLFHRMFGTHERSENKHCAADTSYHPSGMDCYIHDEENYQSYDDFLEEQEDYDMMDDF